MMIKRTILLCTLMLVMTVFGSSASATATPPYASIVTFNQMAPGWGVPSSNPNISTLGVLDIINMTPWDISIGSAQNTQMFAGMTSKAWISFWLAGFHQPGATTSNFGGSFAFHSYQVALSNLNNAWALRNSVPGSGSAGTAPQVYSRPLWYDSVPIVFNSNNFTQGGKTVALNFSVTSSVGFDVPYNSATENYPATALSFGYGDGVNNYGWVSNDTMIYANNWKNTTHFFTIQGLQGQNWKPITPGLTGPPVTGPESYCLNFLTLSGLAYPNFSAVAGDSEGLDLVVIIQAGGYADMQLLFLAVPSSNNALLSGTNAGAVRR